MSDLSTMMQVAPGTASFFMGQNQAQQTQTESLKQRELADLISQRAAEAAQKQEMNPLMLEHQRLQNRGLQEGLGKITADSTLAQLTAKQKQATLDSDTEASIAKNKDTVEKSKYEQFTRGQDFMMKAGPQLAATPPALRAGAFRQMIEQAGMNPNAPHLQAMMAAAAQDPDALPRMASKMAEVLGQQALALNPAAQATMYSARTSADAHRYAADKSAEASRYGSDSRERAAKAKLEQSKKGAVDTLTLLKSGKIAPDRALMQAQIGIQMSDTPEEKRMWTEVGIAAQEAIKFSNTAKQDGSPTIEEDGGLGKKEIKGPVSREPAAGQTSSGTKYKIITE